MRRGPILSLAVIWLSIVCAAFLQIMPLPPFIDFYFRPHWMLLTCLYWCLAMPHRFNIGSAWVTGLMLDVLWGTTFGLNALVFGLCCAFVVQQCQRIRSYSVWHQALIFTVIVFIYQFLTATLASWLNDALIDNQYYFASLVTLLAWPWVFFTLRKIRRRLFLS
jgi:rod shape-determining protein MreD